jgi:hypothetical protein
MPKTGFAVDRKTRRWPVKDAPDRPRPGQPAYLVRLDEGIYFSRDIRWGGCERAKASYFTHKAANALMGYMRRLGYPATVEPLTPA